MDKQQAQDIVRNTFENPFDKGRFIRFVKNLLNHIDESKSFPKPLTGSYIKESFRERIKSYDRIGRFIDANGKLIDILTVCLHREKSIAQARTSQRNFISGYLRGDYGSSSSKDAAIVAFYCEDTTDWRFSLVTIDYVIDVEKLKVKQEFSSAKRFSFLVGENESSHTAQSRLVPILEDDKNNPTFAELEEAFNIEKVTKEFFEKYRDLFLRTKEMLDEVVSNDLKIKADFETKGVNTVDFAKKLLGQIVFLYFLQKKGWFGVARDADWGTGTKHFLRELFDSRHSAYKNFFNDILEPLFYEALRIDRSHDDGYYSRFNCKIPFLNGGLFDPINNYDWVHTDINLPNELFSNEVKTKEGDTGNGILDIFDRYNFTVKEDEPLEKEVAVDPEMLGKVFENLLEVKDRKSKGTYYTPREIVHYMCQQSLINYLHSTLNDVPVSYEKLGEEQTTIFKDSDKKPQLDLTIEHRPCPVISKEEIETLIKYGEQVGENEARVEAKGRETDRYSYKIPESIRQNANLIDRKLADIKVCDPAIGSGAFPVGMMSEIVKIRKFLNSYLCHSREGGNPECENRTPYDFKRECIEKSLYGVDIDPGAVEIAKLRLWLSLVVDEDDIKQIKPLPNLDYKIVCGNSLLGVNTLFHYENIKELERLKNKYFEETNPSNKTCIKVEIDSLINEITHNDRHFDFKVYFSEVFNAHGGFDVVIGNPPYIQIQSFSGKPEQQAWEQQKYSTYVKTGDVYCLFYEKGFNILTPKGVLTFITSNKWMRANYGKAMRKFFLTQGEIAQLIDFGDSPIFESATTYTNILVFHKGNDKQQMNVWDLSRAYESDVSLERMLAKEGLGKPLFSEISFVIARGSQALIKKRIEEIGMLLKQWDIAIYRGILTGMNEAFIISGKKKNELIAKDPKSVEIIKPILRGRDIKRYKADFADLWLINAHNGYGNVPRINIRKDYPVIWKHLQKVNKEASRDVENRQDQGEHWSNLRNCAYLPEIQKEKIVYAEIVYDSAFFYDTNAFYPEATVFIITGERLKYLTAMLNSKLLTYAFKTFYAGGDLRGNTFRYKKVFLENLPVPSLPVAEQQPFESFVDKILAAKKKDPNADTSALEKQIDEMVYALYGLTPEEIAIVERKR